MLHPHFRRVQPIVGASLCQKVITLLGLPATGPLLDYLAASGVGHWRILGSQEQARQLRTHIQARHGQALDVDVELIGAEDVLSDKNKQPPDIVIASGDKQVEAQALAIAQKAACPLVWLGQPRCHGYEQIYSVQIGPHHWDWHTSLPLVAAIARALLLRGTAFSRHDMQQLWHEQRQQLCVGIHHPFEVQWKRWDDTPEDNGSVRAVFQTPLLERGNVLVVGLGSIGSVAAELLAPWSTTLVLLDPDAVDVYNPVRQAYTQADIGQPKASALAKRIGIQRAIAIPMALHNEQEVDALIERYAITTALIATGTNADFAIARALRQRDIGHVVMRCYPRAHYWEAMLVDGRRGPAFDELRGYIESGPAAAPTPEQLAAYSDAGALEAEPATLIESGWAAAWAARLCTQMLTPPGLRERWFLELVAAEHTCLIGGIVAEQTVDGPAYGVSLPGQINAWRRVGRVEASPSRRPDRMHARQGCVGLGGACQPCGESGGK